MEYEWEEKTWKRTYEKTRESLIKNLINLKKCPFYTDKHLEIKLVECRISKRHDNKFHLIKLCFCVYPYLPDISHHHIDESILN